MTYTAKSFNKIFVCPQCTSNLRVRGKCKKCDFTLSRKKGIFIALPTLTAKTAQAANGYEDLHKNQSHDPSDGSYEILGSFARGNTTLDIACGDGYIEKFAPETVGVDFSFNALLKAQKNGAKYLVQADAQHLPFKDNSFDLAICSGSLEHFESPIKAFAEMVRVSKIQIITVHREPFWGANTIRNFLLALSGVKNQPIEIPMREQVLKEIIKTQRVHLIYQGYWNLPYSTNVSFLPFPSALKNIPSCFFTVTIKK